MNKENSLVVNGDLSLKKKTIKSLLFSVAFLYEKILNIESLTKVSQIQRRRIRILEAALAPLDPLAHK